VTRLPSAESDAYFSSRPWQSRLGAWASRQSEPVESRDALRAAVADTAKALNVPYGGPGSDEPESMTVEIARPAAWGGYRLHVEAIELWVEGEFRIHDRALWTRGYDRGQGGGEAMNWSVTRLQP
jgi:pyridoxamine 5'-phosphate oxidase